ncbi:MAG: DUF4922 domain-containing protein [Prevotellaceae bacterium]|nr:DUF4922 domain-containing protein [Prevotellaceae bacterium]
MFISLQTRVNRLFEEQLQEWQLAQTNFNNLAHVRTKCFAFDGFEVFVQYNPARLTSSAAKTDAQTIAQRRCFLCGANRPPEQRSIETGDYVVLLNPYPIFPHHFTIPRIEHVEQRILPWFFDMLRLAKQLPELVIFYNGARCGASAPDHMHFQAGNREFLPIVADSARLKDAGRPIAWGEDYNMYLLNNYLRTAFCIEAVTVEAAQKAFLMLYNEWNIAGTDETMMNIICFHDTLWRIILLPRAKFRPRQYTAEGDGQLLISPGTVEMGGVFVTPVESHFERITKDDIVDIYSQITLK